MKVYEAKRDIEGALHYYYWYYDIYIILGDLLIQQEEAEHNCCCECTFVLELSSSINIKDLCKLGHLFPTE